MCILVLSIQYLLSIEKEKKKEKDYKALSVKTNSFIGQVR